MRVRGSLAPKLIPSNGVEETFGAFGLGDVYTAKTTGGQGGEVRGVRV